MCLKTVQDSQLEEVTTYTVHEDSIEDFIDIDEELNNINMDVNYR